MPASQPILEAPFREHDGSNEVNRYQFMSGLIGLVYPMLNLLICN